MTIENDVILVSGNGDGDYNCKGKDDQVQINNALKAAANDSIASVYLKGPFTYKISDTIRYSGSIILEGDSTAVLSPHTDVLWSAMKPMIGQINPKESTKGKLIIRGFEIDGRAEELNKIHAASKGKKELRGDGFYNMVYVFYDDVEIYNMFLHNSLGDGLRIKYSKNVKFHHNRVYKLGHDVLFAIKCDNVEFWKNNVRTMTNSAARLWNSNHGKIHDNTIWTVYGSDSGGPGLQIQYGRESTINNIMDDIEIYNNKFQDTYGPGISLIGYLNGGSAYAKSEASNVHIHHNSFVGCGTHPTSLYGAGIVTSGFHNTLIENNVFDGNYNAAIALQHSVGVKSPGSGYVIRVRKNIIVNTKLRKGTPSGTGNGVANNLPETHSFVLENNCFFNNAGGDYRNTKGAASDLHINPLFADPDNYDYHLRSEGGRWNGETWVLDNVTSPCIFKEHELGMYDGTNEASIYPYSVIPESKRAFLLLNCSESEILELIEKYPEIMLLRRA